MPHIIDEDDFSQRPREPVFLTATRWFTRIWWLGVILPATVFYCTNAVIVKKYAVVQSIALGNELLTQENEVFSKNALDKLDMSKYTDKIDVPMIDIAQIEEVSQKMQAADIQDIDDKINALLDEACAQYREALNNKVQAVLKEKAQIEEHILAENKKRLGLSETTYKNFIEGNFSLTGAGAKATETIYKELKSSKDSSYRNIIEVSEDVVLVFLAVIGLLGWILLLLPLLVVTKIMASLHMLSIVPQSPSEQEEEF